MPFFNSETCELKKEILNISVRKLEISDMEEETHLDSEIYDVGNILYYELLTLLHSERPKLYTILAFLRVIGLIHCH